jgi:hypothetical protein
VAQGRAPYDGQVTAAGTLTVRFGPGSRARRWLVQQVSVEMSTAPAGATCALREAGRLITPLIPTGDTAAGEPAVTLTGSETLTVEWAGCTPGDPGRVVVIYDESPS